MTYDRYADLTECAEDRAHVGWRYSGDYSSSTLLGDRDGRRVMVFCVLAGRMIRKGGRERLRFVAWCRDTMENGGAQYARGRIADSRLEAVLYAVDVYDRGKLERDVMIGGQQ